MAQPKAKLRTSEEVYKRLKFAVEYDEDSEYFGETDLWLGYEDGIYGPMEQKLAAFVPIKDGGDLPFHSVWYFRCGDNVFWDRRRRLDLLWGSGETEHIRAVNSGQKVKGFDAAADRRAAEETRAAILQAAATLAEMEEERQIRVEEQRKKRERQAARRAAERDKKGPAVAQAPLDTRELGTLALGDSAPKHTAGLRVLTWNAMFDDFLEEYPPEAASAIRAPGLAAAVVAAEPDVVLLQELTPATVSALDEAWPGGWRTEVEGEFAVWSRHPIRRAIAVKLGARTSKQALLVELAVATRSVALASVHFTGNRRGDEMVDNAPKRAEQAQIVRDALLTLLPASDAFICGDFNEPSSFGSMGAVPMMTGLVDAWVAVHKDAPGETFDPSRNALAAAAAVDPAARRIDRIYSAEAWQATSAEVLGQDPIHSDHYGLVADFEFSSRLATAKSVHTSALVALPLESCWPQLDAIRTRFDPSYGRWMPHINLIYGFLPEEDFSEAAIAMEQVLRRHGPVEIRLEALELFEHGASASLVAIPAQPAALTALQADLAALFPTCTEQGRHGQFTPHLTLGKFESIEEARRRQAELNETWTPMRFAIDELALIAQPAAGGPFAVKHRTPLGAALDDRDSDLLARLEAVSKCRAFAVGSALLLGSLRPKTSDFDVLLVGNRSRDEVFAALEAALRPRFCRRADGKLPILELELADGQQLDVMMARSDRLEHPVMWPEACCLDGTFAAGSIRDALALRREVLRARGLEGWQLFQQALPRLRRWTKSRRIDGNALGFLGGFAWALLLAETLVAVPAASAEVLVRELQKRFSSWPWPKPVSLFDAAPCDDPMPILCPTDATANAARNVTTSTRLVVVEELRRAAAGGTATPPLAGFDLLIQLEVQECSDAQKAAAWLEARFLQLVRSLDDSGARPLKLDGSIWLVAATADRQTLSRAAKSFEELLARDGQGFGDLIDISVVDQEHVKSLAKARAKASPQSSPLPSPKLGPQPAPA